MKIEVSSSQNIEDDGRMQWEMNMDFLIELLQNYLLFHLLECRVVRVPADDRQTHVLGQLQEVLTGHRLSDNGK